MPALRTRDTQQSRTLDVTTDAPTLPSLNIVSPTPRAFTFPINHNLADSPYSSPSNSPFEPDLRPFPSQSCTLSASPSSTPPPRALSPDSPLRSSSPSSPSSSVNHKRRKPSLTSSPDVVVERRPKKGDEDYIKRPENAFILFRRKCCEDRQQVQEEAAASAEGPTKKQRQADLSKTISQQWKGLSAEERKYWEDLAKNKKAEHEKLYPNYVYRPQRAKDKDGKAKSKKLSKKSDLQDESSAAASVSFVVPVPRHHGRSASAPTPPPYQSIQIPNVYHMTPSCPTSPSLLPMISRRSAHPGHPEDVMSSFDFIPNPNAFAPPPSYPVPSQFEASLQSSEFLRSMFNTTAHRHSEPTLQQLTVPLHDTLLPAHQIVSPASSISSGSSGPSSPMSGPYTPNSNLLSQNYTQLASDASLEAQAQAEMELQMEMQMQQEFAAFNWESNNLWASESSVLLGDDFDINAIRPVELGMPKYTENITLAAPNASNLEFGHEFTHALEGAQYHDDHQIGLLTFDDMMAGRSF